MHPYELVSWKLSQNLCFFVKNHYAAQASWVVKCRKLAKKENLIKKLLKMRQNFLNFYFLSLFQHAIPQKKAFFSYNSIFSNQNFLIFLSKLMLTICLCPHIFQICDKNFKTEFIFVLFVRAPALLDVSHSNLEYRLQALIRRFFTLVN